jgi:hypothetical protein
MSEPFVRTPEVTAKVGIWFGEGKGVGVSARTIAAIAIGIEKGDWDCPHDADDFGRCYRLLVKIPELRAALPLVAEKCPQFAPLVEIWDELTDLYEKDQLETPRYEMVKDPGRRSSYRRLMNCRSCYDRIKELSDACRTAGGWTKISEHSWIRTGENVHEF